MQNHSRFCLLLVLIFVLQSFAVPALAEQPLKIVTTIFPEYDFARAIAGDLADIKMLIKPGAESHSYEPTPMDIIAIQDCDIFICVGGQNDVWAQRILEGLNTDNVTVIRLLDCIDPSALELEEHDDHEEHDEHDDHAHDDHDAEYDEHIWTSPVHAMAIVSALADAFAEADLANSSVYVQNAQETNAAIADIDTTLREIAENAACKELVFGDRFPFLYFAKTYGFDWVSAFPGCSTDAEASAATVISLINKVQSENIPSIFYIELSTHRIADTISDATGAKAYMLHSCQNVTREEFEAGETYITLMRKNCEILTEALNR